MAHRPNGPKPPSIDHIVKQLRKARIFQLMPSRDVRAIVQYIFDHSDPMDPAIRDVEAGSALFRGDDDADRMFCVLEGTFEERSAKGGTLLWELGPGDIVGEVALFAENPHAKEGHVQPKRESTALCTAGAAGRSCGQVLVIRQRDAEDVMKQNPSFAIAILRGLATDALRLLQDQRQTDLVNESYFKDKSARLVPGPYLAEKAELYAVVARTSSKDYCGFLPRGLHPLPGLNGVFLLVMARFPSVRQPQLPAAPRFEYNETTLFVPAIATTLRPPFAQLALYAPALYPDNFMATLLGREIYGFPKRPARTTFDEESGQATMTLDGRLAARMRYQVAPLGAFWDAVGCLSAPSRFVFDLLAGGSEGPALAGFWNRWAWAMPNVPVVNLKQIPGPGQTVYRVDYDVNELTSSPFDIRRIHSIDGLTGLEMWMGDAIPFGRSELFIDAGYRVVCDFELRLGRRLQRYPRGFETLRPV